MREISLETLRGKKGEEMIKLAEGLAMKHQEETQDATTVMEQRPDMMKKDRVINERKYGEKRGLILSMIIETNIERMIATRERREIQTLRVPKAKIGEISTIMAVITKKGTITGTDHNRIKSFLQEYRCRLHRVLGVQHNCKKTMARINEACSILFDSLLCCC